MMETKNSRTKVLLLLLVGGLLLIFCPVLLAGDLEPTGPPTVGTMKTLDEVEPRIPISQDDIPILISASGSYYLAENITAAATAIMIAVDDVTIDLMGFTLAGPDSGSNFGIYMVDRCNVVIRNGTVRDFDIGIYEAGSSGKDHQVIDVRAVSNGLRGIFLKGDGHLIRDCNVSNNGTAATGASYVYGIYSFNNSKVIGNTVSENGTSATTLSVYGIFVGSGSTVTGNTISKTGLSATGTGNICGLYASANSVVENNIISNNAKIGLLAPNDIRVIDNSIESNGTDGLRLTSSDSYVSGNIVKGNGDNYDIAAGNQLNILLCEIPETIDWPAMVTLVGSLKGTSGQNGLTINANDVTIDLSGHTLEGVSDTGYGGIYMIDRSNVEIRNGTIRDFKYGVIEEGVSGQNHRVIDVRTLSNGLGGIYLHGKDHQIKDCTASYNGESATGEVYGIFAYHGCTVRGNTANNNGKKADVDVYGIKSYEGCIVTGNTARNNGESAKGDVYGIHCYGSSTVVGNNAYLNGFSAAGDVYGIYLGGYCLVDQNTAWGNGLSAGSGTNMNSCPTCEFGANLAP
ncbi:MAG: right-handed parallel beta-helix repeat-containing protein [Sedimentisphaerales bacterium]|nr:right-handed parallel beta-helix repeat-containing protein [Sedimentisphaerales bacterium]